MSNYEKQLRAELDRLFGTRGMSQEQLKDAIIISVTAEIGAALLKQLADVQKKLDQLNETYHHPDSDASSLRDEATDWINKQAAELRNHIGIGEEQA